MKKIEIYDSTLRDGAQGEGVSFSVGDKIKIALTLDEFYIDYIEAGFPASNPKDREFFELMKGQKLKHSRLCAFGRTSKAGTSPEDDESIACLLDAGTEAVCIFGKASAAHAENVLGIGLDDNLRLIKQTVSYLKKQGREVIFDAEHFYAGYADCADYSLRVLDTAAEAGADVLCLCDTNGATLPSDTYKITKLICERYPGVRIGVHFHDDIGCAVANSLLGAQAGASQIQGTFLGFGERCGNADLSAVIPSLKFKCGYEFKQDMKQLHGIANRISGISNVRIRNNKPYIGKSAFYHKAGMHIDAVRRMSSSYEHIDPELVGNERKFLLSEISGRGTLLQHVRNILPTIDKDSPEVSLVVDALKEKEHFGYHYEAAEASLQLLLMKTLYKYTPHFNVVLYKTTDDFPSPDNSMTSCAMVQIEVGGKTETSASLGNGPVNALDLAMRRALTVFFPEIQDMRLVDFKVRVIDAAATTAAKVRVLIETTDGCENWTTVGVSHDIIEACFTALVDSFEYKLSKP